jgi:hypothetical protein
VEKTRACEYKIFPENPPQRLGARRKQEVAKRTFAKRQKSSRCVTKDEKRDEEDFLLVRLRVDRLEKV